MFAFGAWEDGSLISMAEVWLFGGFYEARKKKET
jgi:hypothetical protein